MSFVIRWLVNAAALWVATRIVPGVTYVGGWAPFLGVALVFGFLNAFIRPIAKFLTFPLIIVTLGIFSFVVNGLMLWLTSALSGALDLASAPPDDDVVVTTRMRDAAFKRVLGSMPIGATVQAEGPFGSFTLHINAAKPAVFLAGGIGITPFRSMIRDAAARKLPHHLYLFYSNNRPEDAAFLDELAALAQGI